MLPDTSELIDLAPELLQLGRGVDVFGARLLTRDACRQGLADGRNRQEEQGAAAEQQYDRDETDDVVRIHRASWPFGSAPTRSS